MHMKSRCPHSVPRSTPYPRYSKTIGQLVFEIVATGTEESPDLVRMSGQIPDLSSLGADFVSGGQ